MATPRRRTTRDIQADDSIAGGDDLRAQARAATSAALEPLNRLRIDVPGAALSESGAALATPPRSAPLAPEEPAPDELRASPTEPPFRYERLRSPTLGAGGLFERRGLADSLRGSAPADDVVAEAPTRLALREPTVGRPDDRIRLSEPTLGSSYFRPRGLADSLRSTAPREPDDESEAASSALAHEGAHESTDELRGGPMAFDQAKADREAIKKARRRDTFANIATALLNMGGVIGTGIIGMRNGLPFQYRPADYTNASEARALGDIEQRKAGEAQAFAQSLKLDQARTTREQMEAQRRQMEENSRRADIAQGLAQTASSARFGANTPEADAERTNLDAAISRAVNLGIPAERYARLRESAGSVGPEAIGRLTEGVVADAQAQEQIKRARISASASAARARAGDNTETERLRIASAREALKRRNPENADMIDAMSPDEVDATLKAFSTPSAARIPDAAYAAYAEKRAPVWNRSLSALRLRKALETMQRENQPAFFLAMTEPNMIHEVNTEAGKMRAAINRYVSDYLRYLSGAGVSDAEREMTGRNVGQNMAMNPGVLFDFLEERMQQSRDELRGFGQPELEAEYLRRVAPGVLQQVPTQAPSQRPAPSGGGGAR